ncbi:MAG: twin-arginine translocase TatA/TatE family subunit [Deltaproteobacteria bacterium]|nr:twin-arginine translocase TatA/TatE family subunit [Deltaproteobacteria bacterium]MBW1951841.1 twin-arginine translocase TatA/TatE family subunit [Deltaproteobacteria bacterium]MBW1986578.1 twin-arginine translocase TatA/TatE family subunit [Deltaproteobacteria bacterium]MBW2133736.1 twin-arginine translocase TatA/TatE family subunit [Deltaproteobacteria bacterium]
MFGYNLTTLIIILVIALLLFGPKRLPELGDSIGKAIRGFKRATEDAPEPLPKENQSAATDSQTDQTAAKTKVCPQCHQESLTGFAFCPHCGHRLQEDAEPPK